MQWQDEAQHRAAFASDPELYTLLAFADGVAAWQKARILFLLLISSRCGQSAALCDLFERTTLFLLAQLPPQLVLKVFLAVRRARANHRHTARILLSYLLHHPQIETLLSTHPRMVRDCLEHALGKKTARHFGYHGPREGLEAPLPDLLERYGGSEAQVRRLFHALYFGPRTPEPDQAPTLPEIGATWSDPAASATVLELFYRRGTSPELVERLEAVVRSAASGLPALTGRIALLLDSSASMRGDGAQRFAPIALAVAFERMLKAKCPLLRTYTVGGFGWPPAPEGPTDFGRVLIDALEAEPQLVVLVTDGYENLERGDTARILATLPGLGLSLRIVCCRVAPTSGRRGTEASEGMVLPTILLRGERDFAIAFQILDLLISPQEARAHLVEKLRARRDQWEREVYGWTAGF